MESRRLLLLLCWLPLACEVSDVGAPCNHGAAAPSETLTVTFPALSCDDLLCVYADRAEPPSGLCEDHEDCNAPGDSSAQFRCQAGRCEVAPQHVLTRSMCSQFCESDDECALADPDSNCQTGFTCASPQDLGPFCCEKMCLCRDELDLTAAKRRDEACEAGTHEGCCQREPKPDACGGQRP